MLRVIMIVMLMALPSTAVAWELGNDGTCGKDATTYLGARARSVLGVGDVAFHRQPQGLDTGMVTAQVRPDDIGAQVFLAGFATRASVSPVGILNVPLGLVCQQIRRQVDTSGGF